MEKYDRAVEVRLLDLPHHLDSVYTYYVPDSEGRRVMRGDFVLVPFGAGNRKQSAIVTSSEHREETEDGLSLKPIISVINPDLSLTEEMMGTVDFLCERTFCSIGDAVRRLIPADAFEKAEDWFSAADGVDVSSLNQKSRVLFDYLLENGKTPLSELKKAFSDDVSSLARKMARSGELVSELKIKGATKAEEKIAGLREDADESTLSMPRTTENHRRLYERIREAGRIPLSELTEEGFSPSTVSGLEKRGLINVIKQEKLRLPYMNFPVRAGKTELSEGQARAKKELLSLIDGKPHGALLYGVTGSGKTSVILSLCEDVIKSGKTAIVLVPEIALTWQSVAMFSALFGDRLAVIHSALSLIHI